jgi:nucleotide-binding universal stress UspA family protein
MFKTIIFATDGSAAADRVLLYTEHLARINVAEMLLGSVSACVLRYAPCPVLAVP